MASFSRILVDKMDNPRSDIFGKWFVSDAGDPDEYGVHHNSQIIFVGKTRKECVEYAQRIDPNAYIFSGRSHGCKW